MFMMASSKHRLFLLRDSARVAHDQRRATLFPVLQQNVSPVYYFRSMLSLKYYVPKLAQTFLPCKRIFDIAISSTD
jgi:hypothetical protein